MEISGWGRFPKAECRISRPRSEAEVSELVLAGPAIARGNGRSYGDSALNTEMTIDMTAFDHMIAFDVNTGSLTLEAGVILSDVIDSFLRRGWFPPVTPGTKFVSLGGMIAADVHGKNHHKHGSIRGFVDWLDLLTANGSVLRCSRSQNAEEFEFTIGGMGLTGVILRAAIRLMPVESGWIRQQTTPTSCLDETVDVLEGSLNSTYSVAWIDCLATGRALGRSLVMLGEHARREELDANHKSDLYATHKKHQWTVPFDLPNLAINRFMMRLFNAIYYANGKLSSRQTYVGWDSYFYPLDAILHWNRIYGPRGLAQFQCVLPLANSRKGLSKLLEVTSSAGAGSFLAVLKRLGAQPSRFSFPMEGYTLALDFPVSARNLALIDRLDSIALEHGGRFYLAKDCRMKKATIEEADGRVPAFRAMRHTSMASTRFVSLQSQRLNL